jgi:hypothetical protein
MKSKKILEKAYSHWIKDGIVEIGLGILFTGVGAFRAIIHFAVANSNTYYWLAAGLLLFMLACGGGFNWAVKSVKARVTYPRTGFMAIKPRTYNAKTIIRFIIILILAGAVGGTLGWLSTQPDAQFAGIFVPIIQGIIYAAVIIYGAIRIKVNRLFILAVFSIGIGVTIGLANFGIVLGISFFYFSIGLAQILSGSLALMQFLISHEPVDLSGEIK